MTRRCAWQGTFVVMVTPFAEGGALDEAGQRRLVETLIAEGADGLVVAGSTGEWFSTTTEEKLRTFRIVAEAAAGRVTLLAGVSSIMTGESVALARGAKSLGYGGGLVLPPPYILPSERELLGYFAALDAVGLPLMVYNNPPRTGVNLTAGWMTKLMRFASVVAMKDSVKDVAQTAETLRAVGNDLAIFTGLENYAIACAQRGAAGVVAMAPNVMGAAAIPLYRLAREGRAREAAEIQTRIDLLYHRMYSCGDNPYAVLKACMNRLGRPAGVPRAPILPVEDMASIERLLGELGLPHRAAA